MNPVIQEWLNKAESDFDVAERLHRARKPQLSDAVLFHAQQAVEKFLKARLTMARHPFPRTHDLVALLKLLQGVEPLWLAFENAFQRLTEGAVNVRYPGHNASRDDAQNAVRLLRQFALLAREALGTSKQKRKKARSSTPPRRKKS